ncbi:MAG: S53 family peptidase [Solirubrobacteraceae bacterium]
MRRGISVGAITLGLIFAIGGSAAVADPGSAAEVEPVCSQAPSAGEASCHAVKLLNPHANWHGVHGNGKGPSSTNSTPSGYFPADLQSAYGLESASATGGEGQTVAIVDAYNDPNAAADLNRYRSQFKLPPCEAGCFRKVNQKGEEGSYPNSNTSWSEEISLDLDMVSAICSKCHILLVEASSASMANLGTAVSEAVALGANAVSNSYGGSEFSGETSYDGYFAHTGVAITASAGDSGYKTEYPAASPFLTAVGGTTLTKATNARGWNETVWSGTGSGCSAIEPTPGWQPVTSLCKKRTVSDVAADANPNTGVATYDSYGEPGWLVFGGTSVSSPIVASVYALAGNAFTFTNNAAQALYSTPTLHKVTEGANARRCSVYLCNAKNSLSLVEWGAYNGPTGEGTPNGIVGF